VACFGHDKSPTPRLLDLSPELARKEPFDRCPRDWGHHLDRAPIVSKVQFTLGQQTDHDVGSRRPTLFSVAFNFTSLEGGRVNYWKSAEILIYVLE
jgi:hypothetical protein